MELCGLNAERRHPGIEYSGSGEVMQAQADKERSPRHLISISDKSHPATGKLPGLEQATCVASHASTDPNQGICLSSLPVTATL